MPVQSLTPEQRENLRKIGILFQVNFNQVKFSFQEGNPQERGHNGCSLEEAFEVLKFMKDMEE